MRKLQKIRQVKWKTTHRNEEKYDKNIGSGNSQMGCYEEGANDKENFEKS